MSEEPHLDQETPTDAVRRIAAELKARHGVVDPSALADDELFAEAVRRLEGSSDEIVAVLGRDSSPFLSAIGSEAIRLRGSAPAGWEKKAVRRLAQAGPGEAFFQLRALQAAARRNVIPAVLRAARESWLDTPAVDAVRDLLATRLAGGERVQTDTFDDSMSPEDRAVLSTILSGADESVRKKIEPVLEAWRRNRLDPEFFDQFARFVDPGPEGSATVVGPRSIALDRLTEAIAGRRSVLLVGEHGVGKSTLVREALHRLGVERWIAFEAGASDVMAGQSFIGELEGRVQEIARRTAGEPLVWVFPRFEEAIWSGQHFRSPRGLFDALLPLIEAGRLLLVAEIEPTAYETATQLRPRVKSAFEIVRVSPLSEDDSLAVAHEWLGRAGVSVPDSTLREGYDLALHYLAGAAAPGGLLRLLKAGTDRHERLGRNADLTTEDLLGTLSEATGLPLHVLDPRSPLDLNDVRSFFSNRVLGQPEAVRCLVERIAMIKAGLTDPTRPLGVFLFVGPTGTGKTEIAKAMAEYLFGSPSKLVRFDMSEYQTPEGFERLLGETTSGDPRGATLASAVRKDPFSVVLLDEFEKAHPNVWNLFLQVFDDGRLTDAAGNTADFRHCVIILTSNIGSAIPTRPGLGFAGEERRFEAAAVEKEVDAAFRPELLNRLDRVVVFRPLDRSVMRAIVEHELSAVLQRRGFRIHPWAVEWDDAAIDFLLERGFSEKFGARPLKRAVEQHLLAPLAIAIVDGHFPEGDQFLFITARGDAIDVTFVDPDADDRDRPLPPAESPPDRLEPLITDPRGDVGEIEFLSIRMASLRGRIGSDGWTAQKERALETTQDADFWESPDRFELLGRIEYLDRIEAAMRTAEGLLRRLEGRRRNASPAKLVALLAERVYLLEHALEGLDGGQPPDAVIRIHPATNVENEQDAQAFARELAGMYTAWARRRGMRIEPLGANGDGEIGYAVSGIAAFTILAPETGMHVLELPEGYRSYNRVGVHVSVAPHPEDGASADPDASSPTVVRRYRREPSPLVRDSVRGWRSGRLDRVFAGEFDVLS